MNINFHYFLVKTLAIEAGLDENTAQFLSLVSEMVDDVTPEFYKGKLVEVRNGSILKMLVKPKPPEYFWKNMMVLPGSTDNYYEFLPSITSFTYKGAMKEATQYESVIPFHFYVEHYVPYPSDRNILRTKPALKGTNLYTLMDALVDQIVNDQRQGNSNQGAKDLIRFGMLLHTFADTFAHAGFSGSHGWENRVQLLEVYGPNYKEQGKSFLERFAGMGGNLTSYGHGQLAHLPDVCCMTYRYRLKKSEDDDFSKEVLRCNKEVFEKCAEIIFEWFMRLSGRESEAASRWEEIKKNVMDTACMVSEDIDNLEHVDQIADIWAENYFHDQGMAAHLKYSTDELFGQSIIGQANGQPIYQLNHPDVFYLFNEAAYDFRKDIMGKY